ncbi:SpoIIE family protein phosphatase [bacterium]
MFKRLSIKIFFITSIVLIFVISIFTIYLVHYLVHHKYEEMNNIILEKGIASAKIGKTISEGLLESVIDSNLFTLNEVFDQTLISIQLPDKIINGYKDISKEKLKNIQKYHYKTGLDVFLDNHILKLQEKFLEDPQIVYAGVVDKQGYFPTHNVRYSKVLTGNFIYDRDNNRTKRVFNDPVAINIQKNINQPYLKQIYRRDTGEIMWDISCPVFVKSQYWGAFRIGFSMVKAGEAIIALRWKLILFMAFLLVIITFIFIVITSFMMRPLSILHDNVDRVAKGDFYVHQDVTSNDEIGGVARAFNKMVEDLKAHMENLEKTTRAKDKIENELDIAHDIQQSIIPKVFPAFPDRKEFDIYGVLQPARQVGGDFYDFFFIDEDHLCLVIADVSDKGVPASLFMAVTKTLVKATAKEERSPEKILTFVNKELVSDNSICMFVTIFCGILNIRTGELEHSNAGHNSPLLIRKDKNSEFIEIKKAPSLGIVEDVIYEKEKIMLNEGDILYMYTDGITEAMNTNKEMFGEESLKNTLSKYRNYSVDALVKYTLQVVEDFADGEPQSDDITIMALEYLNGNKLVDKKNELFAIKNDISQVREAAEKITKFCKNNNCAENITNDVNLAVEEIIVNIISYGYKDNNQHDIKIELEIENSIFRIKITDGAETFNLLEKETDVEFEKSIDKRAVGGLGIFLVKNLMDNIFYNQKDGKNILIIEKRIQ